MTAIDRRYVRLIGDAAVGDWHEMKDVDDLTLCDKHLDSIPDKRYQHQRGTGFPVGRCCIGCADIREFMDVEQDGPITYSAASPW